MDLNGDGIQDMITGSYNPGDLYLFAGCDDGTFKAGQTLKSKDGKSLNVGLASAVFAADWDRDGDLDLIVGNIKGEVYWIVNQGKNPALDFANPEPVEADGKPLVVDKDAGPCIADWDGDGNLDLLVGDESGAVTLYRNTTSQGLPQLAAGITLVPKSKYNKSKDYNWSDGRGIRSKLCVADWNEDGRLDLLLGDYSTTMGPELEMTQAQHVELAAARAARIEISMKMGAFSKEVRQKFMQEHGIQEGQKLNAQQTRDFLKRLTRLRENNESQQLLQKELQAQSNIYEKYQVPTYRHGYVWVYLRSPASPAIMEADAQRSQQ